MSKTDEQAFPFQFNFEGQGEYGEKMTREHTGLTKREYTAIKVLQAILSQPGILPSTAICKEAIEVTDEFLELLDNKNK